MRCNWERLADREEKFPVYRCRQCGVMVDIRKPDVQAILDSELPCGVRLQEQQRFLEAIHKARSETFAARKSSPSSPSPSSVTKRARRYARAVKRWIAAGCPTRSPEQINHIFKVHCKPCQHFCRGRCTVCGCRLRGVKYRRLHRLVRAAKVGRILGKGRALFNKLALSTESCPRGYWPAEATPPKAGQKKSRKSCKLGLNCRKPNR